MGEDALSNDVIGERGVDIRCAVCDGDLNVLVPAVASVETVHLGPWQAPIGSRRGFQGARALSLGGKSLGWKLDDKPDLGGDGERGAGVRTRGRLVPSVAGTLLLRRRRRELLERARGRPVLLPTFQVASPNVILLVRHLQSEIDRVLLRVRGPAERSEPKVAGGLRWLRRRQERPGGKKSEEGKERALPGLPPLDLLAFLVVILAACDDESIELSSRAQALATETFPAPLGPMPRHSALLKLPLTIVVCAM